MRGSGVHGVRRGGGAPPRAACLTRLFHFARWSLALQEQQQHGSAALRVRRRPRLTCQPGAHHPLGSWCQKPPETWLGVMTLTSLTTRPFFSSSSLRVRAAAAALVTAHGAPGAASGNARLWKQDALHGPGQVRLAVVMHARARKRCYPHNIQIKAVCK